MSTDDDVLQPAKGRWVRHWTKYPESLLALLIETHEHGWKSEEMSRQDAYSLKVRLQKMTSAIRDQDGVAEKIAAAANVAKWSCEPSAEGTAYHVIGTRRAPQKDRNDGKAPESAKNALAAILATSGTGA